MNVLFYSDKCQFSMTFIKKLQDEIDLAKNNLHTDRLNLLNNIKLINVLTLKEIPQNITSIPTIIINNINGPLTGLDAFAWLDNTKYFHQKTNSIKQKICQPNIVSDPNSETGSVDVNKNKNKNKNTDGFANLKDEDDDKITNTKFIGAKQNVSITDFKQQKKDEKAVPEIQNSKINELIMQRKYQMQQFINSNKKR